MIRRDGSRKDLTSPDAQEGSYKDENGADQEAPVNHPGSGWGLRILKQHESKKRSDGISQRRLHSKGSFVDLIGDTVLAELTLADDEECMKGGKSDSSKSVVSVSSSCTSSTSSTSSGRTSVTGGDHHLPKVSSKSRHPSSSSVGSSGESSIDGYFDEEEEEELESGTSPRRSVYKRGLSQRRIRGSSEQQQIPPMKPKETVATVPPPPPEEEAAHLQCSRTSVGSEQKETTRVDELFTAVKTKDEAKVKSLHSLGVSLESTDKNGMTPLIVACLDGSLLLMARTLIGLGANVRAYRSGVHAGYPLHHAAKRGHEHTVGLLLSSGAEALAVNDDGQTALDMARIRGHASVVRVIEDWISLFRGILRLITDNAGSQIMKRMWAVVLPSEANNRGRHELVLYNSRKVPMPEFVILLGSVTSDFEEPDYSLSDPALIITDRVTKTKFKFFSHEHGDKGQVSDFYKACKGIPQDRKKARKEVDEPVRSRRSSDGHQPETTRSGNSPAIPRSRAEKPGSRKNVIYPEESLNDKSSR